MRQLIRLLLLMLFFLAGAHPKVQADAMREKAARVTQQDLVAWSQQALESTQDNVLTASKPLHGLKKRYFRKFCLPDNDDGEEDAPSLKKSRTETAAIAALSGLSNYFCNSYPPAFSASCYSIKNLLSFCKDLPGRNTPVFCILFQVFRI